MTGTLSEIMTTLANPNDPPRKSRTERLEEFVRRNFYELKRELEPFGQTRDMTVPIGDGSSDEFRWYEIVKEFTRQEKEIEDDFQTSLRLQREDEEREGILEAIIRDREAREDAQANQWETNRSRRSRRR